jgi:tetratricopeptide (TPR) repeat protein
MRAAIGTVTTSAVILLLLAAVPAGGATLPAAPAPLAPTEPAAATAGVETGATTTANGTATTANGAATAAYEAGLRAVAAGDDAGALERFEAALVAAPDDLRSADQYRKAVIRSGEYDRALDFFDRLTTEHPGSAGAWLNYGYAYVDKIPAAGAITQVILANEALTRFTRSIEIERSWIALYTRGNSYLYWPTIFGRAPLAVADLEEAVALARKAPRRLPVYVRAWIALGDGYVKTDQEDRARATWQEGLEIFPGDPQLEARLARRGEELDQYLYEQLDPAKRVDTSLEPLWSE